MMEKWLTVGALTIVMAFALACDEVEDLAPKAKVNANVHVNAGKIVFEDGEGNFDSDWTIGELVEDSTWEIENITAQSVYPRFDNQITFIGDDTIRLDWGGVAAIRTDTRFPVSEITCRLFSGSSELILYLEFERSGTLVCSTVHVLVDSLDKMTWVGYENISILRRVGEYCDDDDDDEKEKD